MNKLLAVYIYNITYYLTKVNLFIWPFDKIIDFFFHF